MLIISFSLPVPYQGEFYRGFGSNVVNSQGCVSTLGIRYPVPTYY